MKNNIKNKNIFVRSSVQDIGELANYFYEEILLLCESDEINNLKGSNITGKAFKDKIENKIKLEYNDTSKKIYLGNFELKINKWILNKNLNVKGFNNKICYVSSGNKIISLIKHLRNAFAHNMIVIEDNRIIVGDFLSKKNSPNFESPTMLGNITIENFKLLIDTIKSLKKQ